ncbi:MULTISPECIES: hypothetical protein [unclassified Streptomyces]|uniref:hypothetical protein n=1 Tax=unclassified Streptomyces TaxID=2593676 RepID=UPI001661013A|nr:MULTISPECIES: hypothetical protein [unclassified Streptomyces]MBD0710593.1 hypothetical protein [Streptomyces sp. CBMA291]MBD0715440.1 hypothetical protein [Streptomyces sp. CBMA370]
MSVEPTDYVARMRAEADDPAREEALRRERKARRRRYALMTGAGLVVLGGFGYWLADSTGERPPYEASSPHTLDEKMWPADWPYSVGMPYRNSPARGWASDADGIYTPMAVPGGKFTAKEMTAVFDDVKKFLTATNIPGGLMAGEVPPLLDPSGVDDAVRKDIVTRFEPGLYRIERDGIRSRGEMTYEISTAGELVVHTDYTFVYALVGAVDAPQVMIGLPEVARVAVRRQMTFTSRNGKLVLDAYASEIANHDCASRNDGYLRPLFAEGRWRAKEAAKGSLVDLYAEKRVLAKGPHCVTPETT